MSVPATDPAYTELYRLEGVERRYQRGGSTVHALVGIDLTIDRGELLAVEGPSGSGKSTLLQLLGALDTPTAGQIAFDGQQLAQANDRTLTRLRRDAIGFVFQQFNLIPTLTAAENVEIAMLPLKRTRGDRMARVALLLEQVGLADRSEHLPTRLSGGEQQRVAIARALANEPRVVLADEPTGNLDSATAGDVIGLLAGLCADSGVTVVLVTHDEEVAGRARRRIKLRNGQVQSDTVS
ncbi:MAG: putative transport system ATP-binding protein [Actinomycetota bacterium]|jgi:putative ABC transport system ATP-binding protein|nr:putative transport system ATP-binding protein [Actinomycetota bacterium]